MGMPHHYVIPGVLEKAYEIEKKIIADLERRGYDDNAIFSIRLAMDEALINGLKHGNKNDPRRFLKIDYLSSDHRVVISVEDEGEGFDYNNIADPTESVYLKRPHGRGIFLIRKFMHDVTFNDKGNRITFVFEREKTPNGSGEMMGLHWAVKNNLLVITIEDQQQYTATDLWQQRFDEFLGEKQMNVAIDVGRLGYVNTTLLSFLVFVAQRVKDGGGQCTLCAPQDRVTKVIKTANLDQIIPIQPDLDSAIKILDVSSS